MLLLSIFLTLGKYNPEGV